MPIVYEIVTRSVRSTVLVTTPSPPAPAQWLFATGVLSATGVVTADGVIPA